MITGTMPRKRAPGRPRKHGGRRPGAGRPPIAGVGVSVMTVRFTAAQIAKIEAWAERHGLDNFSEALREMVEAADRLERGTTT